MTIYSLDILLFLFGTMSDFNSCFLTCIQISQEAGQVVWYLHLFQSFPQFIVIHTVKGFGIVNKGEIDVSLKLSCFIDDPSDAGNLISGSSAFSKTSLKSRRSQFTYCWSLAWRILSIILLACEMSAIVRYFEHSLALPFFGIGMKTNLFEYPRTRWEFSQKGRKGHGHISLSRNGSHFFIFYFCLYTFCYT